MIFNLLQLSRITKLLLIIFSICGGFFGISLEDLSVCAQTVPQNVAQTQDQSFSKQIDQFLNSLIKVTKDECARIFGKYNEAILFELEVTKLYVVSFEAVKELLDQAVKDSVDSLTLFTLPLLQNPKGVAIVFDKELLEQVNKRFDFHGLFNISAASVEDNSVVEMTFLIVGQGKFIVGYSRNAKIKHPDYDFATGKYDYRELFVMDAGQDSAGNSGLFNIKGRSSPNGQPQWMKGPLNVDIHSTILTSGPNGRKQILIQYDLFGIQQKMIDPIPVEKLHVN